MYYPFKNVAHKTFTSSIILDTVYIVWYNFKSVKNVFDVITCNSSCSSKKYDFIEKLT